MADKKKGEGVKRRRYIDVTSIYRRRLCYLEK